MPGANRTPDSIGPATPDARTNQQLRTWLTQPGVDAYKQTNGGFGLRSLDQRAQVRPPPPPGGH